MNCRETSPLEQEIISSQICQVFQWCIERFPLCIRKESKNIEQSITEFIIGYSLHKDELLSASSAQALGVILLSAPWPLKTPYRLASLIAHESMHQALYYREFENSPVRPSSLGYSPWKNCIRPGRLVWHSFWTFICQFVMLGENALKDQNLMNIDTSLAHFIADMQARIMICYESLKEFKILNSNEVIQCDHAIQILNNVGYSLAEFSEYKLQLRIAEENAFKDYSHWAKALTNNAELGNLK